MARAPETGYYFEPLTERLALVIEGAPFPSDDHWAWLGDPIDMTAELARLTCGLRWPGVDPDSLQVELEFDLEGAMAELHKVEEERAAGLARSPEEYTFDMDQFLEQMAELRLAAETLRDQQPATTREALEQAAGDAAAESPSERPSGAGTGGTGENET